MKFFAVILSFYFLGLNFVPCDDTVESDCEETVTVNIVLDQDQHESEQDNGADECPPFCQCHCCHVHVVQLNSYACEVLEPQISTLIIQKGENFGEEIPDFHFQPPRV